MSQSPSDYYLPQPSNWPIKASLGLGMLVLGAANWLHHNKFGPYLFGLGFLFIIYMMYGWFSTVIRENRAGLTSSHKSERSFRYGMLWFIFSEVCFFAAFFGALFFTRIYAVPLLGGHTATHYLLWPEFSKTWPIFSNPNYFAFVAPKSVMYTWGLPALNTLILLTSGATITVAHWAVVRNKRGLMIGSQLATILLGLSFLLCQSHEYIEAYTHKGLTLASGIYGTTFFMLTGFHGLHVTIGTIMLIVILYRMFKGDIRRDNHFSFAAVSWYWHFVDVVWLLLFVFVYWL